MLLPPSISLPVLLTFLKPEQMQHSESIPAMPNVEQCWQVGSKLLRRVVRGGAGQAGEHTRGPLPLSVWTATASLHLQSTEQQFPSTDVPPSEIPQCIHVPTMLPKGLGSPLYWVYSMISRESGGLCCLCWHLLFCGRKKRFNCGGDGLR